MDMDIDYLIYKKWNNYINEKTNIEMIINDITNIDKEIEDNTKNYEDKEREMRNNKKIYMVEHISEYSKELQDKIKTQEVEIINIEAYIFSLQLKKNINLLVIETMRLNIIEIQKEIEEMIKQKNRLNRWKSGKDYEELFIINLNNIKNN
tara:strand:+ start:227 stop:676 length:450 start_codon:yes stop_codon:yes gene_type:complete